jgi:hypothetical protein
MMTIIKCTVFMNKKTKQYKWLSWETSDGTNRYLYESGIDTTEQPSKRPLSGNETSPASFIDYERSKDRIRGEGYDIVTEQ